MNITASLQIKNNIYQVVLNYKDINGKRKQISKSGFKTKRDAYIAGQRAYEEFINGENTKECNMLYSEYLDYWMREYFEINYKYSTAKRALLEEQQAMYQDIDVTHKTR